ncbi:MAG TPA: DNA repair protein RecO, partial [Humisphaera sp.]
MPLVRDRAICLRKTEYSETSQIVTLLTRDHGLFRAIAKGAHRKTKAGASKFDGGMDFLEVGEAVFTHDVTRDLATLTEWTLREGHLAFRSDLRAMYLAIYAGELVDRLLEQHDPHPELFDRLEQTLPELASPRREEAFLAFELDLLRETGHMAEVTECVACHRPAPTDVPRAFFSADLGGTVCRDCEMSVPDRRSIDSRLIRLV